jgi:hypothetical protein
VVTVRCDLGSDGYGCVLTVDVETAEPFVPSEAVTLCHRREGTSTTTFANGSTTAGRSMGTA